MTSLRPYHHVGRSSCSCLSHRAIWFQLAPVWSTTYFAGGTHERPEGASPTPSVLVRRSADGAKVEASRPTRRDLSTVALAKVEAPSPTGSRKAARPRSWAAEPGPAP